MYSEVDETVRLLTSGLFGKIPRRKVILLSGQLKQNLLLKYEQKYHKDDPSIERAIFVNMNGVTDSTIVAAANSLGLNVDEVLKNMPDCLTVWIKPGEVLYRFGAGEFGPKMTLYRDDGNCPPKKLTGVEPLADVRNWDRQSSVAATITDSSQFTVGSFARTRFGTTKKKTNLDALRTLQLNAIRSNSDDNNNYANQQSTGANGSGEESWLPQMPFSTPAEFGGPSSSLASIWQPPSSAVDGVRL